MKKYLYEYIDYIEKESKKKKIDNKILEDLVTKINFFQHERLIHLIITLFYALMFLIFMVLISLSYLFAIPSLFLLIFLLFYIVHYFRLENGVQYLYKLYDIIYNSTK